MQAVLTHLLFAEEDPGESLLSVSLLWGLDLPPLELFDSIGEVASASLGISEVVIGSDSSSRFGEVSISSEKVLSKQESTVSSWTAKGNGAAALVTENP